MIKNTAQKKINELKKELLKSFNCSQIQEKNYNYEFTVSDTEAKLKVQVYFGKKGVKVILQGNQDSSLYSQVSLTVNGQSPSAANSISSIIEPLSYVGTDESGKGDYFGPLVTAAVFINETMKKELVAAGVKDSKELSDLKIGIIADDIRSIVKNNFEILVLEPEKYNELYSQIKNLNKLLNWCHTTVIENLITKVETQNIIVDKFSNEKIILTKSKIPVKITYITSGERFTAVAAASILARDAFNRWFLKKELENLYLQKGASAEVERVGRNIVEEYGFEKLKEIAKLHFKTTDKLRR